MTGGKRKSWMSVPYWCLRSSRTAECPCCINDRGTTELQEWIDTINLVAASLSSPPLPSGVGSQARFQRPLMPSACTKLGIVSHPFSAFSLFCTMLVIDFHLLATTPLSLIGTSHSHLHQGETVQRDAPLVVSCCIKRKPVADSAWLAVCMLAEPAGLCP